MVEQFNKNKEEHNTIMNQLNDFKNEILVKIAELPQVILDKADERYASKTTERAVYGLIGAIVLAFVYAVIELIKK